MSSDRCGYVYNAEGVPGVGATCCWRPVADDDERCIWHTERAITRREYDDHRPERGERLDGATFRDAPLSGVDWLADCGLVGADFTDATLDDADLSGADLREATFREVSAAGASFDGANLHDASFVVADLRGATFRDARLYRLHFADARVDGETQFDEVAVSERRLQDGSENDDADFAAATWIYRELEHLYEDNAMPERGRAYYLRGQDLRRRYAWLDGTYARALFLEASRWVTLYGTSPWRILAASAALIVGSAVLYPLTGGIREVAGDSVITYRIADPEVSPTTYMIEVFFKSLYFSVVTFSSLGYGDIQPVGGYARLIASVETLLGTLLMALLIFVLTRRLR